MADDPNVAAAQNAAYQAIDQFKRRTALCTDCKHHQPRDASVVCTNPKLAELAAMVDGKVHSGQIADAIDVRINESLCGAGASWFEGVTHDDGVPIDPVGPAGAVPDGEGGKPQPLPDVGPV
jgi:hypothetical protein